MHVGNDKEGGRWAGGVTEQLGCTEAQQDGAATARRRPPSFATPPGRSPPHRHRRYRLQVR
eukprot:3259588-Alexandrium_andersonii.AAC.1